ncbi:MAG: hypothetical protein ACYC3L_13510, partial [Gemmatimonadaceae bacterium]
MLRNALLSTLLATIVTAGASAQDPIDRTHDSKVWHTSKSTREPIVLPFDWSAKTRTGKVPERVTPSRRVAWRIDHFNFMRFEPVVSVDAKTVPGYALLESLWSQVMGLVPVPPAGVGAASEKLRILGARSPFLEALEAWRIRVASAENNLAKEVTKLPTLVALSDKEVDSVTAAAVRMKTSAEALEDDRKDVDTLILRQYAISMTERTSGYLAAVAARDTIAARVAGAQADFDKASAALGAAAGDAEKKKAKEVAGAKEKALADVTAELIQARARVDQFGAGSTLTTSPITEAYYAQQLYESELVIHKAVVARLTEFRRRAEECAKGRSNDLETRKAGTIVTVTAKAKAISESGPDVETASKADPITVSYYVQSEMPLVFHAGVAWTSIEGFDYQLVQKSLSGDVFQRIQKPEETPDLTA